MSRRGLTIRWLPLDVISGRPCLAVARYPWHTPRREDRGMRRFFIIVALLCLAACSSVPGDPGFANHPLDCAMGFRHADCNPGTAGYNNGVAMADGDDA